MKVDPKTGYGLKVEAWALMSFKGTPRIPSRIMLGGVFGIYATKKEAREWARGTKHKVVPVVVAVGAICGMTDCNHVHAPDWGKKR